MKQEIAKWLRERVEGAGANGIVVGLSGGIDSAVVAGLSVLAMPENVVGVIMPCQSNKQDAEDAIEVAKAMRVPRVHYLDLTETHRSLVGLFGGLQLPASKIPAHANLKSRLRMASLYFVANSLNYLVAGTGNRSELEIGYFTKYGDGGVDLLPIGRLFKSEVRTLAANLGVPQAVIDKAPSAGLWDGQTDEGEMGFTYEALESYFTDGGQVDVDTFERITEMRRRATHKLEMPPVAAYGK